MLDLAPHLVFVVHIVVQVNQHHAQPVLRRGGGLRTPHLTIGEKETLQGTRYLLFYLLGRSTWIDGNDHTLTDGGLRKFVLRHVVHAEDTQDKQDAYDEQRDRVVFQWPLEPVHLLHNYKLEDNFRSFAQFLVALDNDTLTLADARSHLDPIA